MRHFAAIVLSWLPLAAAITVLCLLIHVAVQQNYRQSLNDPQIQMAEDAARALEAGTPVAQIIPVGYVETVDLKESLAPWLAFYDATGTPLLSTGVLDGAMPQPPKGLFDISEWQGPVVGHHFVQNPNEDIVSWQPQPDVRQAIVIVPAGKYFVIAGRNMREVENREASLNVLVLCGWLAAMGASLFFKALEYYFSGTMKRNLSR